MPRSGAKLKIMQNQKGISSLVGIIIVIAVAIIAFGGVFAYQYFSTKAQPVVQTQQNPTAGLPAKASATEGWKTYTNNDYNFQIEYPNNWFAEKNSEDFAPGYNGPDLVFCPPNLTYHSSGSTGCMNQPSGYQSGMIYLFTYDTNTKPNNINYQYLGFNSGKYYYLFNDNGSKDIFTQILSTFKFTTPTKQNTSANQPSITVTSPTSSTTCVAGRPCNIKWESSGMSNDNVGIFIANILTPAAPVQANPGDTPASSGSYSWTVPASFDPGHYTIKIVDVTIWQTDISGTNTFTINSSSSSSSSTQPSITVTSPNGGEIIQVTTKTGTPETIQWTNNNFVGDPGVVNMVLLDANGFYVENIAGNYVGNTGKYLWSVPWGLNGQYMVQISSSKNSTGGIYALGRSGLFTITSVVCSQ